MLMTGTEDVDQSFDGNGTPGSVCYEAYEASNGGCQAAPNVNKISLAIGVSPRRTPFLRLEKFTIKISGRSPVVVRCTARGEVKLY